MSEKESYDDALEVGEASAGEPSERGEEEAAALEDRPRPSPEELAERQALFRDVRRHGGPDLQAETAAREEGFEVPDIAPTKVAEAESPREPKPGLVAILVGFFASLFRRTRVPR